MKKILPLLTIFFSLFLLGFVSASTLNVDVGNGSCVSGSQTYPYSGDYCTIQDAIDDSIGGDIINVSSGTYNEELTIDKGLSLIGSPGSSPGPGPGAPVLDGEGVEGSAITLGVGVSSVTIQGFEIKNYANPVCCTGGIGSGIIAWNTVTSDVTVLDNYFHDLGWNGILVGSDDGSIQSDWLIQKNIVESSSYAGIELTNVIDSKVTDNYVTIGPGIAWDPGDSGVGIEIAVRDRGTGITAGTDIVVNNNKITGDGIAPERAGINILSRAYVDDASSVLEDVTIINNSVTGATRGIYVVAESRSDGDATIDDLLIRNNTLNSNGDGIVIYDFVNGGDSATHGDINIEENIIINSLGPDSGIHINPGTSAEEIEVHFNYFVNNSLHGVNNEGSGTLNATHNWWGSCTGPTHSSNLDGEGDEVSDDVLYEPWTGICLTDKVEPICKFEVEDITLQLNVTSLDDLLDIDKVWISYDINGVNFNETATNTVGNIYFITINSSELIGGQNITWTAYANDTLGFVFRNGLEIFYVRNKTSLTVDPPIPGGLNGWYIVEPEFELSGDVEGDIISYIWDTHPDGPILYSGSFGLEKIPNAPPEESAGILDLNWWSSFACGNESTQTELFHIDLTNPTVIPLSPENGSTVVNNLRPVIEARLEETFAQNSGIDIEIVEMSLTGTSVPLVPGKEVNQTGIDALIKFSDYDSISPNFNLSLGENNVTINVTDNAGRNSMFTWFFTIDQTPALSMIVNSPENKTYDTRKIPFNISLDGEVKLLQYINYNDNRPRLRNLCRNCDEYGFDRTRTKSLMEGENKIGIRATDSLGAINEVNVSLFIDSKNPRISRTEPGRNKFTNGSDFFIRYTEDNVEELLLSFNPEIDLTSQCNEGGRNKECFFDISTELESLDGQEIEYWFNMTDIANKTDSSRPTKVFVDTTKPNITFFNYSIDRRRVEFVFNITELNFDEINYIDWNDNRPRERKLCSRLKDGICEKKKTFKKGEHNLTINVLDEAGNSDIRNLNFTIS